MSAAEYAHRVLGPLTPCRLHLGEGGPLAQLQDLLARGRGEQVHDAGDDAGPSGLMAGAQARAVVAVEVLVEQEEIAPMRIVLELPDVPVDRPSAILVAQKNAREPAAELFGDLIQGHVPAGARGTFDGETITVVGIVLEQGANDERV